MGIQDPAKLHQWLLDAEKAGRAVEFELFYGHSGQGIGPWVLSQWWNEPFDVDGTTFETAEHFMMAAKALTFLDHGTHARILAAASPAEAKALGRKVRGFDQAVWDAAAFEVVVRGNVAKFSGRLRPYLLGTGQRVLVEASPTDRIWGIGLGRSAPGALTVSEWRGRNLLGFALCEARRILRS